MTFLERLEIFKNKFSYNQYRFDKASNFVSFEQWVDEKVKRYAESLIKQPTLNAIYEREDKNVTLKEIGLLSAENCYDSVKVVTKDGKHWGLPPHRFQGWKVENKYSIEDITEMKLENRGWL